MLKWNHPILVACTWYNNGPSIWFTFNKKLTRTHTNSGWVDYGSFIPFFKLVKTSEISCHRHLHACLFPFLVFVVFCPLLFVALSNQCDHKCLICIKFLIFYDMICFPATALFHSWIYHARTGNHSSPSIFTQFAGGLGAIENGIRNFPRS